MQRIFVGIALPDDMTERLALLQVGIPGARWIPPDNFHITLAFLGELDPRAVEDAHSALSAIHAPAFDVALAGMGTFGDRPHTLWAGVMRSEALVTLQGRVETALRRAGLKLENRRYQPHVTLARLKNVPVDRVGRWLERFGLFQAGPFTVHGFHLFESHLGGQCPVYDPLVDYELA